MASKATTAAARRKTRNEDHPSLKNVLLSWSGGGFAELRKPRRDAVETSVGHHWGMSLGFGALDRSSFIGIIRAGLSIDAYDHLCLTIGIAASRLADIAGIPRRTLARRRQEGRLRFEESERVFRVATLFDRAVEVLGDVPAARQWFDAPAQALGGDSPLECARTEIGAREAEDLLGRLEHGVFS